MSAAPGETRDYRISNSLLPCISTFLRGAWSLRAPLPRPAREAPMTDRATSAATPPAMRALAMNAADTANSGHSGMPVGMAEIAAPLWTRQLRHDAATPRRPDHDRLALGKGHRPVPPDALLRLSICDHPHADVERCRRLRSSTAGHAEVGATPGRLTDDTPCRCAAHGRRVIAGAQAGDRRRLAQVRRRRRRSARRRDGPRPIRRVGTRGRAVRAFRHYGGRTVAAANAAIAA
jgi:hypothetical protein